MLEQVMQTELTVILSRCWKCGEDGFYPEPGSSGLWRCPACGWALHNYVGWGIVAGDAVRVAVGGLALVKFGRGVDATWLGGADGGDGGC